MMLNYSSYLLYIWPVTRPAAFVLQTSMIPHNLWLVEESCDVTFGKHLDIQ